MRNATVVGNHPVCVVSHYGCIYMHASTFVFYQFVVKGRKRTRIMRITDSFHKIGNAVGKRKRKSIYHIMKDSRLVNILVA